MQFLKLIISHICVIMKTTKKANNEANIAYNEAIRYVENAIEILKKKQEKKINFIVTLNM